MRLFPIGLALILLGFLLVFLDTLLTMRGKVEGAGIVMIGPIPIIFGSEKLAIVLALLSLALMLLFFLISKSFTPQ